jgi:beta-hydroxylase
MPAVVPSPRVALLLGWLAAALFVHLRSRVRLKWPRQLVDHSTLLAPYNALVYLFEARGRRRGPFLEIADTAPELTALQDPATWRAIRDEALALRAAGRCVTSEKRQDLAFNTFFERGWTRFVVRWYGNDLPSAERDCPRTVAALRAIPRVRAALFAVLPAGARLGRHRDPFAGSLRYHLGLATPNDDGCWIEVDGERYSWRDGEAVLFDETFVHRAKNETSEDRLILFCDVERPIRFPPLRWVNRFLVSTVLRITQSRNAADEPLGALNHVTGLVVRTVRRLRHVRRVAPRTYRITKFALLAGIVWWLFLA